MEGVGVSRVGTGLELALEWKRDGALDNVRSITTALHRLLALASHEHEQLSRVKVHQLRASLGCLPSSYLKMAAIALEQGTRKHAALWKAPMRVQNCLHFSVPEER